MKRKSGLLFHTLLLASLLSFGSQCALAAGKNSTKSDSSTVIKGGIKDEASLKPSIRVIDGKPQKGGVTKSDFHGELEQYVGGTLRSSGSPFPTGRRRPEFSRRSHSIRPITDYYLRPSTRVMTFGGRGVMVAPSHTVERFQSPGYGAIQPRSHKGITTFVPGYETTGGSSHRYERIHPLPGRVPIHGGGGRGVSCWMPGYAAGYSNNVELGRVSSHKGITAWVPGYDIQESSGSTIDTVFTPGSSLNRIAYRKGVSAWAPGYQVTVSTNGGYKTSLGGKWFEPAHEKESGTNVQAESKPLPKIFAQPVIADGPLLAKANLLPQLRKGGPVSNITWKDWFNSVASSIYSHWQAVEIGPGTAKVRVTITSQRDINAQVEDFFPAPYVDRNMDEETAFKVAALNSVLKIDKREIPRFPPLSDKDAVTFSVMLKRTVDGPIGIDMSKLDIEE